MFNIEDFIKFKNENEEMFEELDQYLLEIRLGINKVNNLKEYHTTMAYYSSAILGSIAIEEINIDEWRQYIKSAADIEYMLYIENIGLRRDKSANSHLIRAAILYELASYHSISALMSNSKIISNNVSNFFSRKNESEFGRLKNDKYEVKSIEKYINKDINKDIDIIQKGLDEVIKLLGEYMQNFNEENFKNSIKCMKILKEASLLYNFNLNADEIMCLKKLIEIRGKASISNFVSKDVLGKLQKAKLPSELWKSQIEAVKGGLMADCYDSWGLATPTGTGKTALAQLLLIIFLNNNPDKKAFYIVPSRALATQVSIDISNVLEPLGYKVSALGSHLTYNENVLGDPKDADVLIFTPEKADLILRMDEELITSTNLVIVDEAHHIESGTRGVLLEFYLWRVKKLTPKECRIIQLSAVAPNIESLVSWLVKERSYNYTKLDWRPGLFRIGVSESLGEKQIIKFNTKRDVIFEKYDNFIDIDGFNELIVEIGQLAQQLSKSGLVLILASSKKNAEMIAKYIEELRRSFFQENKVEELTYNMKSLDAKLERELYDEVPLRENIKFGVAYHHSGLPARVRYAVEQVIKEKKVNIVCATTTLAEGVNFPFSTVIVESLIIGRNSQMSPRELWNIAGRAGRFGVDAEGQCILYDPQRYIKKLNKYALKDYLDIRLDAIPEVTSAFAEAINLLSNKIISGKISDEDLKEVSLRTIKQKVTGKNGKEIVGMLNMYRVGLAHAHVSKLIDLNNNNSKNIVEEMMAYNSISEESKKVINTIENTQKEVVKKFLLEDNELMQIAARIGWTIESQNNLWNWIKSLEDWQIKQFGNILDYSKNVRLEKLNYLLFPVANNMTEFQGDKLGGFTSYIAEHWIAGNQIKDIRIKAVKKDKSMYQFSELINYIYSRIQYLLPWALYGVNELLEYESRRRKIQFNSGVKDLSILSSEGVPNFDALMLCMSLNIERVDATRLADIYRKNKMGLDIISWFKSLKWNSIEKIIRGNDNRRIDPDLQVLHQEINENNK